MKDGRATIVAGQNGGIGDWVEGEASGGGLAVLGWGFGAVVAFVLALASRQYAPTRFSASTLARNEIGQPDPDTDPYDAKYAASPMHPSYHQPMIHTIARSPH